jgi:hypothetical protein
VVTSYTRRLEAVIVKGTENQEVYVTFSPQFERIWLESKKRLPEYVSKKPANLGLRSQYSIRFYDWAKKYVEAGTKTASLEELRRVLGLESVKDAEGNVIHEAPMPVWANFRQRAPDVAVLEINAKTDLKIKLVSIERSKAPPRGRIELSYQNPNCSQGANEAVKTLSATPAELPDFVEPMQAKLVNSILPGDWIYEVKFDGYRALALRGGPETKLSSCLATKRISPRNSPK